MRTLLKVTDLETNFYTYEGVVRALNRVSLVVDHGTTFGLVGESGCGKSVTVRSVMRIVPEPGRIEGGKVILFLREGDEASGIDILSQSEAFVERLRGDRISMIFQEPNSALNPIMSIGEQICESYMVHRKRDLCTKVLEDLSSPDCRTFYPLRRFLQAVYKTAANNPEALTTGILGRVPILRHWQRRLKKEAERRAVEIVKKLGIPDPEQIIRSYPHQLSGGMKQRIVIAIALACDPLLLIADEATSNLDVTIQAQILELLAFLRREVISSILLITHDLGVVAETCDRVGVMYAGNLCEVADVDDLFNRPLHPYTKALLDAVPKFSTETTLRSIEGNVPNLVDPPPGCRFHPRCPEAMEVCRESEPELKDSGQNHLVACYLVT